MLTTSQNGPQSERDICKTGACSYCGRLCGHKKLGFQYKIKVKLPYLGLATPHFGKFSISLSLDSSSRQYRLDQGLYSYGHDPWCFVQKRLPYCAGRRNRPESRQNALVLATRYRFTSVITTSVRCWLTIFVGCWSWDFMVSHSRMAFLWMFNKTVTLHSNHSPVVLAMSSNLSISRQLC